MAREEAWAEVAKQSKALLERNRALQAEVQRLSSGSEVAALQERLAAKSANFDRLAKVAKELKAGLVEAKRGGAEQSLARQLASTAGTAAEDPAQRAVLQLAIGAFLAALRAGGPQRPLLPGAAADAAYQVSQAVAAAVPKAHRAAATATLASELSVCSAAFEAAVDTAGAFASLVYLLSYPARFGPRLWDSVVETLRPRCEATGAHARVLAAMAARVADRYLWARLYCRGCKVHKVREALAERVWAVAVPPSPEDRAAQAVVAHAEAVEKRPAPAAVRKAILPGTGASPTAEQVAERALDDLAGLGGRAMVPHLQALRLVCEARGWVWTHDHLIRERLWPRLAAPGCLALRVLTAIARHCNFSPAAPAEHWKALHGLLSQRLTPPGDDPLALLAPQEHVTWGWIQRCLQQLQTARIRQTTAERL